MQIWLRMQWLGKKGEGGIGGEARTLGELFAEYRRHYEYLERNNTSLISSDQYPKTSSRQPQDNTMSLRSRPEIIWLAIFDVMRPASLSWFSVKWRSDVLR